MSDLPPVDWLLTLDIGTRSMGWAAGRVDAAIPHCGTWELPGMADQGALYGRLWEKLGQWCERRRPDLIAYVRPFMNKGSIAAEGLGGLSSVLHLFCTGKATRLGAIPLRRIDEADARAAILDPNIRKLMAQASRAAGKGKGAGSKLAKAMAMEWCRAHGLEPSSGDAADATIVWEYTRGLVRAQQQGAAWSTRSKSWTKATSKTTNPTSEPAGNAGPSGPGTS